MKLGVMIVDNEPLARERLRTLLKAEPEVEIIAECANGADALAAMKLRRPDVVFLDIQMPEMNGFELLEKLEPPLPLVIFVTAFDDHAVRAFEAQALDYLVKPFKASRFRAAVARAREQLARQAPDEATGRLLALLEARRREPAEHLTRVAVRDGNRVRFVKAAEIDWIEASGNYVTLHVGREAHLVREILGTFEAQLSPREFVRISRSAIVNLDRIRHIEPAFNDEHVIVLADGTRLSTTRSVRDLHERLKFGG